MKLFVMKVGILAVLIAAGATVSAAVEPVSEVAVKTFEKQVQSTTQFRMCRSDGVNLAKSCSPWQMSHSGSSRERIVAGINDNSPYDVVELQADSFRGFCWIRLPSPLPDIFVVGPHDLHGGFCDRDAGWKTGEIEVHWFPNLPDSTPIYVGETVTAAGVSTAQWRSLGELTNSGEVWTITADMYSNRFVGKPKPAQTYEVQKDKNPVGALMSAISQSGFRTATASALAADAPELSWKTLSRFSSDYQWVWKIYVAAPNSVREKLLASGARYAAALTKELKVNPSFVRQYITRLTWNEVADMDPTLLELTDLDGWEGEDISTRAGIPFYDVYARLWWRRRGKTVFEGVQKAFLEAFPEPQPEARPKKK